MKKIMIAMVCGLSGIAAKAQTGTKIVYIPQTASCYETTSTATVTNGNILILKMTNATSVQSTRERVAVATDCTKGEFQNDDTHNGTHNIQCDITVDATCFCTGVK